MLCPRRLAATAFLGAGLLLSGCFDGPRLQTIYTNPLGTLDSFRFAATEGREVPVHVVAAPFAPDTEVATRVADQLTKLQPTLPIRAAGGGLPTDTQATRILILHETPDGYSGRAACRGQPYTPSPNTDEIRFIAVVCSPRGRLVELHGILPHGSQNMAGSHDDLLRRTAAALLIRRETR